MFFWTTTFKSNVDKWLFDTKALFFPINLIIIVCCESIIFSEMKVGALKSELLREDSRHSICCFVFFFHHLSKSIDYFCLLSINYFSEMEPETLKTELLFEDNEYSICCFCSSLNIFSNQFDHYFLTSINYFLRNEARRSQKRTFARRQWAQYLLFLFFIQHLFKSI